MSGTPTFILFRAGIKLDQLQGSDAKALEDKIKKWMGDYEEIGGTVPKGYVSLIAKYFLHVLNLAKDKIYFTVIYVCMQVVDILKTISELILDGFKYTDQQISM